ncbi:membrane protein, partial [Rhodopirellula maiorica SM1]
MPEPLLFAKAFTIAMVASAFFVLAITKLRAVSATTLNLICVAAIAIGLGIGFWQIQLHWAWPAASALDRFLTIILPAVLIIELISTHRRVPVGMKWGMRLCLAMAAPRILIHQSVYLTDPDDGKLWQTNLSLLLCVGLIIGVWLSLDRLSRRIRDTVSIPLALCMSIQS